MKDLTSVFDTAQVRSYPKGQILLYQGEKTQNVFQIREGHVKVYDINAQGTEKLMLIIGSGDVFPLIWTFGGSDALHYFYETYNDSKVCVISKDEVLDAIRSNHQVAIDVLEYFVDRTQDLMNRIDCIDATSAKHKIAQVLTYLARAHGKKIAKGTYKVKIAITHQAIADMAGITRETASVQLKELQGERMFKSDGDHLIIHEDRISEFLAAE